MYVCMCVCRRRLCFSFLPRPLQIIVLLCSSPALTHNFMIMFLLAWNMVGFLHAVIFTPFSIYSELYHLTLIINFCNN